MLTTPIAKTEGSLFPSPSGPRYSTRCSGVKPRLNVAFVWQDRPNVEIALDRLAQVPPPQPFAYSAARDDSAHQGYQRANYNLPHPAIVSSGTATSGLPRGDPAAPTGIEELSCRRRLQAHRLGADVRRLVPVEYFVQSPGAPLASDRRVPCYPLSMNVTRLVEQGDSHCGCHDSVLAAEDGKVPVESSIQIRAIDGLAELRPRVYRPVAELIDQLASGSPVSPTTYRYAAGRKRSR